MGTFGELQYEEHDRRGPDFAVHRYTKPTGLIPDAWGFRLCFAGTATWGVDYRVSARGRPLRLDSAGCTARNSAAQGTAVPAGGNRSWFTIDPIDDIHEDSGETIVISVSRPYNTSLYKYGRSSLTFVILNDEIVEHDGSPVPKPGLSVALSAEHGSIAEAYGKTRFRIELSRALLAGEQVTVPFMITGGQWKRDWHVKFQDAHNGPGVERMRLGRKPVVRFAEGSRVATLVLVAHPNGDTEERTIRIAFGAGKRAPRVTGVADGIVPADSAPASPAMTGASAPMASAMPAVPDRVRGRLSVSTAAANPAA